VGDFLATLNDAVGKRFTGYKGGEYIMDADTPLWVANNGETGGTAVVDVRDDTSTIRLITDVID
jgi:hypothetical protein